MSKQIPEWVPGALPCPFCGQQPQGYYMDQGYKWGGVECCIKGPDVRTNYDESPLAPWRFDAVKAWNTRA